jgi:hypothetical protein
MIVARLATESARHLASSASRLSGRQLERLARGSVSARLGERRQERIGRRLVLRPRREQRQIVEAGGDPAGRGAALLELGEHDLARARTGGGRPASLATAMP